MIRTTSALSVVPAPLGGKIIVLTGGAGIYGGSLVTELTDAGATLVLASRNVAALDQLAASEQQRDRQVYAHHLDQADETSILQLRDWVTGEFGRVDGLVNNAVLRTVKHISDPLAGWDASMKVNAIGLFAMHRAFGDAMAGCGSGSIVNISSIQGMVGPDYTLYEGFDMDALPDYFFHKAGMINLTRLFAAYYGPKGVRVNSLSPGGYQKDHPEVFVERYARKTFLRRMARDHDLGGPLIFLLSDAASYVTGVNLPVDGGYTAN